MLYQIIKMLSKYKFCINYQNYFLVSKVTSIFRAILYLVKTFSLILVTSLKFILQKHNML